MFKPPFMSEADALDHCVKWIEAVAEQSDEISINPMNIQRGTSSTDFIGIENIVHHGFGPWLN